MRSLSVQIQPSRSPGIELDPQQLTATKTLYEEMRRSAVALGEELLLAESRLDHAFEKGSISPQSLETVLLEIGRLRAQLRYVHLQAHLRQKQLLSSEQIQIYDAVRGYHGAARDHGVHPNEYE